MATFTLTGGGAGTLDATRPVIATIAVEINDIELGSGPLGPQPFGASDGGDVVITGWNPDVVHATFALSGGGATTAAVTRQARPTATLTGGGNTDAVLVVFSARLVPCVTYDLSQPSLLLGPPPAPTPADLVITLAEETIDLAPASVMVILSNGTPDGDVVFEVVDGSTREEALTISFDSSGTVAGLSVPIDVATDGSYRLEATDVTTGLVASAPFTVAALNTAVTLGAHVVTPPSNVQNAVGVRKWVFQDPASGEVYHFVFNPSAMASPFPPKKIVFAATTAIDGARLAFEGQPEPVQWQFEGTLFTKPEYDSFVHWLGKRNRIWLTDHYNRAWLVYLTSFAPVARRSVIHPWCHTYTMTALIFDGPVTPA